MNWGKATVAILLVFVLFICGMGYFMFKAPADDYDHQYYEDGLNFDHDYSREMQVTRDHAEPSIVMDTCCIRFIFPQIIKGQVNFMRPSSDAKDALFPLDNKGGKAIEIITKNMARGKWQLVFNWKSGNKDYLYQKEVYVR
ncbi:FixH protein [Mucilaginibacter frigoritolerans]|uniref:FixH protein n=1 Tax=Mucilaginibacter frigoritolerans TaxID=652788 RepID=A0A562U755_9SPHI|nr:FixH family protein [Mucilaginibacter frigoritolerans]TWJ01663.1 FixH protein [Mucilaginibacter frigoritolerans]